MRHLACSCATWRRTLHIGERFCPQAGVVRAVCAICRGCKYCRLLECGYRQDAAGRWVR